MIKYSKHALSLLLSHILSTQTSSSRGSFFSDVSVNLGGHILSFDDLEHGILRGNTKHPYKLAKQFDNNDPRRYLSILSDVDNNKAVDHRIHFTLNCGANSCPSIMQYTPEKLNEELYMAAVAFCGDDANVCIIDETREICFSKLLYWYMSDFGTFYTTPIRIIYFSNVCKTKNNEWLCLFYTFLFYTIIIASSKMELPTIIGQYLTLEKKNKMDKVIQSGKYSIHFLNYDWSTPYIINTRVYMKGESLFPFFRSPPPLKYDKINASK